MSVNLFFFFKVALVILCLLLFRVNFGICYYLQKSLLGFKLHMSKNSSFLYISFKQLHQDGKTAVLKVWYGKTGAPKAFWEVCKVKTCLNNPEIREWCHQVGNTGHFWIQLPHKKTNWHLSIVKTPLENILEPRGWGQSTPWTYEM